MHYRNNEGIIDLNLLKSFNKVAKLGSYTKAALILNQPKSRVSRAISRLEDELSVQLIRRTTRAISLTEEGKILYHSTKELLHQLDQSISTTTLSSQEVKGILTISAPEDFAHAAFGTIITEFSELYPDIQLKIQLTNSLIDLTKDDIDLAIRIGKLKDSSLKQRKIGEVEMVPIASPDYLRRYGFPKNKEDLKNHKVLSFYNENRPHIVNETFGGIKTNPFILCNSFPMLKILALQCKGIALLPNFLCQKEIINKKLVHVLPDWKQRRVPIQIVYPQTSIPSAKIRVFIDYLASKNISYF